MLRERLKSSIAALETNIDNEQGEGFSCPIQMSIVIGILTFVLILIALFLSLVVLAQKSKDGGVGAAMGGGAAEAAFGAETNTVLSKATINAAIAFFVLSFILYLGHIYQRKHAAAAGGALPTIAAPAVAPAAASTAVPAPAPETTASTPAPVEATPAAPRADQPKPNP